MKSAKGFTLIELLIALAIIGLLAAVAIPKCVAMEDRAKEGAIRSNMYQFQHAAEDYWVQHGVYAATADAVVELLPAGGKNFANPFTKRSGRWEAWEDRADLYANPSSWPGITSYADTSGGLGYNIKAWGEHAQLSLVLTNQH